MNTDLIKSEEERVDYFARRANRTANTAFFRALGATLLVGAGLAYLYLLAAISALDWGGKTALLLVTGLAVYLPTARKPGRLGPG